MSAIFVRNQGHNSEGLSCIKSGRLKAEENGRNESERIKKDGSIHT